MPAQESALRRTNWPAESIDWLKTLLGAFLAYMAFTTVAFAQYEIPSESMVPHLEVGDRVTVSKFAYGYSRYSLPLEAGVLFPASAHRVFETLPRRGDVVVFIHPVSGETLIKRAIGLPGDVVAVRDGALIINGRAVDTTAPELMVRRVEPGGREWAQRYEETLPGGVTHATLNLTNAGALDNFGPYVVPPGHIFFMGDNRDNSRDSRWSGMGPVPVENLIGRAELVYATAPDSCGRDPTVACRMQRWMRPLHH
jgi:signal peptidase I